MTPTAASIVTFAFLSLSLDGAMLASAQDGLKDTAGGPGIVAPAAKQPAPTEKNPATEKLSLAERIAHLKRSIENDLKELEQIKLEEENPENEYRQAESRFQMLDTLWTDQTKKLQTLKDGGKSEEAGVLEKELAELKKKRELARDRFNLTIQERKTLREKTVLLRMKVQQDQAALNKLTGEIDPPKADPPPNGGTTEPPAVDPAAKVNGEKKPATPAPVAGTPGVSSVVPPAAVLGNPGAAKEPDEKPVRKKPAPPVPKELLQARAEAKNKEVAAKEATQKVESVTERLNGLRKNIALEQQLMENARKKAAQAKSALAEVEKSIQSFGSGDLMKLKNLNQQKAEFVESIAKANDAFHASQERLDELQTELNLLQREELVALREADQKRQESDSAQKKVAKLQNPFAPTNMLQWTYFHGPRLLGIVVSIVLLHLLVRLCSKRIAQVISHSSGRGTEEERENRSLTLVNVFRNTAALALFGGGAFMMLDEVGIPIMPLVGGAAVVGLAVAFGAQNLIRDYFSGFMVLMEDQYGINDVVSIDNVSGVVEKISLRMTVLRDIRGVVHFIPHGTIQRVSNLSHGWSRAFFEVGIAYKEDPDRVMEILLELGKQLRLDRVHGPFIIEDPEMLGVDSLGDSSINIRFFIKTKPLKQWGVQRELLRRIKRKFDELGIEIPFPHRTVYHHFDSKSPLPLNTHLGDDADVAA